MTPLFNEIVIFKSEKFRFKKFKKKDLETCKSCKFSSYGRLFYCCLHWYDKFYNWNCGRLGKKRIKWFLWSLCLMKLFYVNLNILFLNLEVMK